MQASVNTGSATRKSPNPTSRPPDITVRYNALTNDRIQTWKVKKTVSNKQKTPTKQEESPVKTVGHPKPRPATSPEKAASNTPKTPTKHDEPDAKAVPKANPTTSRAQTKPPSNIRSQIEIFEKKDSQSQLEVKSYTHLKLQSQVRANHTEKNKQKDEERVTKKSEQRDYKSRVETTGKTEQKVKIEEVKIARDEVDHVIRAGKDNRQAQNGGGDDKDEDDPPMTFLSAISALQNKVGKHAKEEFTIITKKHHETPREEKKQRQAYVPITRRESNLKINVKPWGSETTGSTEPAKIKVRTAEEAAVEAAKEREKPQEEEVQQSEPEVVVRKEEAKEVVEVTRASAYFGSDTDNSGRNSLIEGVEYQHPRAIDFARKDERKFWMDIPEVVESGLLERLDKKEKIKQEAKFELMFSEATFLHTLDCLRANFMSHFRKHIPQVISQKDFNILFNNIMDIRDCSEKFLRQLDEHWQEDLLLGGMYETITKYASNDFKVYIQYCKNMLEMSNHLVYLMEKKAEFKNLLDVLTNRQTTQKLTLDSFLTTPMQRITKMPLLMKTILDKVEAGTEEHAKCVTAYEATCKIAQECDEVVNEKKKMEEMLRLNQQLDFPPEVRSIPVVVQGRYLEARYEVKHFAFGDRNTKREKLTLILFNDLLLVAKKVEGLRLRSEQLTVVDHCPRDQVQVRDMESGTLYNSSQDSSNQRVIIISLSNNSEHKKVDLVVTFKDPAMCVLWMKHFAQADTPVQDSIQVIALQEHEASDPEELTLAPGDVVQVISEERDGWCYGELLSDGTKGKFLVQKTAQITSQKQRMANMKLRKEMRQSQHSQDSLVI